MQQISASGPPRGNMVFFRNLPTAIAGMGPWRIQRLESRLILWVLVFSLLQVLLFAGAGQYLLERSVREEAGRKALNLARLVAELPQVREALEAGVGSGRGDALAGFIEGLRRQTDADFIVVGDTRLRRLAHPKPDRLGKTMQGGDSQEVLAGRSIISSARGSLGFSVRGKAPVRDAEGRVIGLVSVGFLDRSVESVLAGRYLQWLPAVLAVLLVGVLASLWMARRLRAALFGWQPHEIARLFAEQNAILDTVRSGIVALDPEGWVQKSNRRARELLGVKAPAAGGLHLRDLFPDQAEFLLENGEQVLDGVEVFAADQELVLFRRPLRVAGTVRGLFLSFRPKDEVAQVSRQLAQVEAFAELLRVQTHDYSNKLNTLGALVQMGAYDKAVDLIGLESRGHQAVVNQLLESAGEPLLAGLLLGKYHKAKEQGVVFEVAEESTLEGILPEVLLDRLVSILGNLIDNAIEAARSGPQRPPRVRVTFDDLGDSLVFDVEDSGTGLHPERLETLFRPDYSSKSGREHGVGLYLVKTHVSALGGTLEVGQADLGGARFTVYLPRPPEDEETAP
ncbi:MULTISPECIES: sensor histidine kinase [unclassified Microbulbifer]|uniref:sensor histidine kinase n=1 Tax=unclassified Microbulbifer TaxID=2619833 RepID=UPI0027E4DBF3|nr:MULTISPECIES: sensor histidine kinase [unclassified Microbulbifer]